MRIFILMIIVLIFVGCLGVPKGIQPVKDFELDRYLGKWYEIARLDHSFERGLEKVSAEYLLRDDGGVRVINRGFLKSEEKWKSAEGRAYFVRGKDEGYLKVSFFRPFYGAYIIFELDHEDYEYAFVTSSKKSYLWLLSRTPNVSDEVHKLFMSRAEELGFDTGKLIFVNQ